MMPAHRISELAMSSRLLLAATAGLALACSTGGGHVHTDRPSPRALPLPHDEETFVFAVFGDRTGGPAEGVEVLAEAVDEVNLIEPDLVLTVGDLIQGYNEGGEPWLAQMREYRGIMDGLTAPWFPVAGNHDTYWRNEGEDDDPRPRDEHDGLYEEHFGPLWYAFLHKDAWFVVLYTDEGRPDSGQKTFRDPEAQQMSPEQFAWLDATLTKAEGARHVFVFLHHPRWIGNHFGETYGDGWDAVHERLVEAGNVSAVFAGHIHRMRYDEADGIEYFTLATTGGWQGGHAPEAGYEHHYELVMVREDHIAIASYPVGAATDPRLITGEVSDAAEKLAKATLMTQDGALALAADGSGSGRIALQLTNPVDAAIEVTLSLSAADPAWSFEPDHHHVRVEAGATRSLEFGYDRSASAVQPAALPAVEVSSDLLLGGARFGMPLRSVPVAVSP
jgi:3',5'-cyclic AMP phosphodiesterase CpdA